jgi:hypothetical protein
MRRVRLVTVLTLTAFLAGLVPVAAEPATRAVVVKTSETSPLQVSIDRAAKEAATQFPRLPARRPTPVRKQMTGGGGGGGMMVMTLLVTAASLAGTYFVVKELKKSTDEAGQ